MENRTTDSASEPLLVVSNRLPVTVARQQSGLTYKASAGGLATAMSGMAGQDFQWVGWPGMSVREDEQAEVRRRLAAEHHCIPIFLTKGQIREFYNGFCNGVLWPLFHYFPEFTDFDLQGWSHYRQVNEQFADAIASDAPKDAFIWVHDYHLMLLPRLLRERLPDARIGFFLHTPFPSSEVFRLLPVRRQILEGLLGADVVGFHTYYYMQHFSNCCRRILGHDTEPQFVSLPGRRVRLSVNPIGIDMAHFTELADAEETQRELKKLSKRFHGQKLILGVDRLDYSKGIKHKLEAFRRFLERYPEWAHRCVLLQIAVPSRTGVPRYKELRREIEELVGHVNGLYSTAGHVPIHFLFQSVPPTRLSALYQLADVCWVTSIRDGMNLVCQEYAISQRDAEAVLLLSEFAGAAHELEGAVQVNPWDAETMASALKEGLEMPADEKRTRLDQMQAAVRANTSSAWARKFMDTLKRHDRARKRMQQHRLTDEQRETLRQDWEAASQRFLLLDYAALASTPKHAAKLPALDAEMADTLGRLAEQAEVYVISDASRDELERAWGLPEAGQCAERGHLLRPPGSNQWRELAEIPPGWTEDVRPVMDVFAATTPGAVVESRVTSLRWNWRDCEPDFGGWQANELAAYLNESLAALPLEVVHKYRSIEVRPQGVNQGALSRFLALPEDDEVCIVAVGDETSDDAFFTALPDDAWTCRVGATTDKARHLLASYSDVATLLACLADCRPKVASGATSA